MRTAWRLLAAALLAAGCTWTEDVPPERLPRFVPGNGGHSAIVALVLGSGGPRGFAHVGVLKVLEENGIRADLVVGTSVGAMVGALYADGKSATEIEAEARAINVMDFFEWSYIRGGPATGAMTQKWVNEKVEGKPIESLRMPFAVTATRLRDNKQVLFNHGDTGLAVRASSASPGQFTPVQFAGEMYVDGDESSPVPIRAARSLGAKFVIAVDVSAYESSTPPNAPREWVEKDARRTKQVAAEAPQADVLLHPDIGYYAGHDKEYRDRVIAAAERYTRQQIPAIRAAYAKAGLSPPQAHAGSTIRMPAGEASR